MGIVIDPTVPANTEAEALGAARMRAISAALQQMFGGQGTTALAFTTPPFGIDTTSGLATVPGNPTNPLGIATKQYVDATAGNAFGGAASGDLAGNYPSPQVVQSSVTTFAAENIAALGNITAEGNLLGVTVTSTQDVVSDRNITANSGTIQGKNITATSGINSQGNITATGSVSAANISASGTIQTPSFNVTGTVTATNVTASSTVSASSVSATSVSTSGNVSAGGNVSASGNVTATGTMSAANATGPTNLLALAQLAGASPTFTTSETKGYFEIPIWTGSRVFTYIVQFGFTNDSKTTGQTYTITYPIAFPNGVVAVVPAPFADNNPPAAAGYGGIFEVSGTTQFTFLTGAGTTFGLYWIAIGY